MSESDCLVDPDPISASDAIRKKQKLKTVLTTIGESLERFFKERITEKIGERPSYISINDVNAKEIGTSKSKVFIVTYYLSSDCGDQEVNLVVKFSANEERYYKEIDNYKLFSDIPQRHPGIYMPLIVYKSPTNHCIIYEGVSGKNFRESKLDKNFKHNLAGQTLSAIHGIEKDVIDSDPYKKLVLYLISTFDSPEIEETILDLILPSLRSLEKSQGSTTIHGDFHQGNILFSSEIIDNSKQKTSKDPPKIKTFFIDPEFAMSGRDRCEDIGTFFAKPTIIEFRKYQTVDDTKKNLIAFLKGYDHILTQMKAGYGLLDLYPSELTIDFHIASFILYDISTQVHNKKKYIDSKEIQEDLKLLKIILKEKPFQGILK